MELQFLPGPARKLSTNLYDNAECTVNKLLMMGRGTARNMWSFPNKFGKLVHLVGFLIKKFVTMRGHMNVKLSF